MQKFGVSLIKIKIDRELSKKGQKLVEKNVEILKKFDQKCLKVEGNWATNYQNFAKN